MTNCLPIFQDLDISGDSEEFDAFLSNLDEDLTKKGWSRNTEIESTSKRKLYAINTKMDNPGLDSTLFLIINDKKYVSNIFPRAKPSLTIKEYNLILNTFYQEFIEPIKIKYPKLIFKLSDGQVKLSDLISKNSVESLELFSSMANKSTGSSHPLDRERWYDFIISIAKNQDKLDINILNRWLVEIDGWSEDIATDLAIEFEFGVNLLKKFMEPN